MSRAGLAVIAALALLIAMPSAARKMREVKPYTQLANVPEDDRARVNPLASHPDAIAAGRKLYERHCVECHGINGEAGRKGPSLRVPEIQDASDGALFWIVTNGNVRDGMPVWSKLPEPQRWQIVSYVKSLGAATPEDR